MAMVFCRGCAKRIHESAPTCPMCGAPQLLSAPAQPVKTGSSWLAIVSLVLGVIGTLALFDESEWDRDTVTGLGLFSIAGLICGVASLSQKKPGERMAIAGVVLSSITLLVFIGLLVG